MSFYCDAPSAAAAAASGGWRRREREKSHQHTLTFRLAELPCVDCVLTEDGTGHPSRSFHTPGLTSSLVVFAFAFVALLLFVPSRSPWS